MPRKSRKFKKKLYLDPKYKNPLVGKFIGHIMERGKKSVAQKIVYGAFDIIKEKTKKDPLLVFDQAIKKVSPILEVKSRRVGGANYQVPYEVRGERKTTLALRWIINVCRSRSGKPMAKHLAEEILEASAGRGAAFKKKEDTQRMALANKAFAHFAY
ncbi:MAG: 30S ribosomal protein S7 [Patescibacteria group bacterium]